MKSWGTSKRYVDELLKRGWCKGGMQQAVRAAIEAKKCLSADATDDWCDEEIAHSLTTIRVLPDAWRFKAEGTKEGWGQDMLVLELVEVEDTSFLTPNKMARYGRLWFAFDESLYWHLRIWIVDRYGHPSELFADGVDAALAANYEPMSLVMPDGELVPPEF